MPGFSTTDILGDARDSPPGYERRQIVRRLDLDAAISARERTTSSSCPIRPKVADVERADLVLAK
jgi:hypothetical protein